MNRDAATTSIRVHMLSGSAEYRSEAALAVLGACLEKDGMRVTVSRGEERGTVLPDLNQLDDADVLLVFCKRMELAPACLARIQEWCRAGQPVVGIRTASHAFQNWPEFDCEVLGGDYRMHGPPEPAVQVEVEAFGHPIVAGVTGWTRPDKLYRNPSLALDATVLLSGTGREGTFPVAWCRRQLRTGGRVFYTSLGCLHDFGETRFITLLRQAVRWAAGRLPAGPADAPRYWVERLDAVEGVPCPCGLSRRAFVRPDNALATLHVVDIRADSRVHYHRKLTEIYLVLEGEGFMELDGATIPVNPMTAVFIMPGCRHRATGAMRIANVPIPAFDPTDEWFD